MFDVAPSELVVICIAALVVLGPTRLPGLVRKVGRWVGKARAMARDFREQLETEVNVEELNRAAKQHLGLEDTPAPFEPPTPTGGDPVPGDASRPVADVSTPESPVSASEAADSTVDLTYPYGRATDISTSADPSVLPPDPHPDDTYSHAHGFDEAPRLEPEPHAEPVDAAADAAAVKP